MLILYILLEYMYIANPVGDHQGAEDAPTHRWITLLHQPYHLLRMQLTTEIQIAHSSIGNYIYMYITIMRFHGIR